MTGGDIAVIETSSNENDACPMDAGRIIEYFKDWDLDDASRYYVRFHAKRYAFLLKLLQECIGKMPGKTCERLLDIGPGFLTQLLRGGGGLPILLTVLDFKMVALNAGTAIPTSSSI